MLLNDSIIDDTDVFSAPNDNNNETSYNSLPVMENLRCLKLEYKKIGKREVVRAA